MFILTPLCVLCPLLVFCHLWVWGSKPGRLLQTKRNWACQRGSVWRSHSPSFSPTMSNSRMYTLHLAYWRMGKSKSSFSSFFDSFSCVSLADIKHLSTQLGRTLQVLWISFVDDEGFRDNCQLVYHTRSNLKWMADIFLFVLLNVALLCHACSPFHPSMSCFLSEENKNLKGHHVGTSSRWNVRSRFPSVLPQDPTSSFLFKLSNCEINFLRIREHHFRRNRQEKAFFYWFESTWCLKRHDVVLVQCIMWRRHKIQESVVCWPRYDTRPERLLWAVVQTSFSPVLYRSCMSVCVGGRRMVSGRGLQLSVVTKFHQIWHCSCCWPSLLPVLRQLWDRLPTTLHFLLHDPLLSWLACSNHHQCWKVPWAPPSRHQAMCASGVCKQCLLESRPVEQGEI